jgi:hypothetical protein
MNQQIRDIIIGVSCLLYGASALPGWYESNNGAMLADRPMLLLFGIIPVVAVGLLSLAAVIEIDLPEAIRPFALMRPALARGAAVIAFLAVVWPVSSGAVDPARWSSSERQVLEFLGLRSDVFFDATGAGNLAVYATIALIVTALADPRWSITDGSEARRWQHSSR